MKRTGSWVVAAQCLVAVLGCAFGGQSWGGVTAAEEISQPAQAASKPAAPPASQQPAAQEKIAYTFEDEAKLNAFRELSQQRQAIVLRMTVLQAYWNQEQANLSKVEGKLAADYKLDLTKAYTLDSDRRVLIERPAAPVQEATPAPVATQ